MTWRIITGDCRDVLRSLPAGSAHTVCTSPPYFGLRDYGAEGQIGLEPTPDEFVAALVAVFREVRRVLRDDGTVWLNLGDSYCSTAPGTVNAARDIVGAGGRDGDRGQARKMARVDTPEGMKPKDLMGVPWMVAFALRADGWYLRSDIIWCLSGGTRLYARTQKGEGPAMLKDLARLDPSTVQLWNGEKWTQVLGWSRSPEPRDGAIEVELRSGERIGCTAGHLWPTQRGNVRADNLAVGDVIATTTLPEPAAPDMPAALPDGQIGWLVGRYLADGSASGDTAQIACHANEGEGLLTRVLPAARALHGTATLQRGTGQACSVNLNGPLTLAAIRAYIYGTSAHDKGLTARAWRRSNRFLHALLEGYLSGDGHYDQANDRWRLGFTRNDRLAADLRTIAARLGCSLTLKATHGTGFGQRWPIYRGELRWNRSGHWNERDRGEVVAIRRSRARQFWDVGVADEPHLFALGSGVLTHNSKPNPMPESVTDRPTKAHEYVFLLSKGPRYFYDADAIREEQSEWTKKALEGNWQRKADAKEANAQGSAWRENGHNYAQGLNPAGRNKRSVWTVATQPYAGAHFATFPPKLIEPCILAGAPERACGECGAPWVRVVERERAREGASPVIDGRSADEHGHSSIASLPTSARTDASRSGMGTPSVHTLGFEPSCSHDAATAPGVVLDPFAGSGTTGMVALRHGRSFVGIELNAGYARMARERIIDDAPLLNQPAEVAA